MTIGHLAVDHYRIPLPVVLSDRTHGDIAEFELVTVLLRDAAGAEGLGYNYTVGKRRRGDRRADRARPARAGGGRAG